MNIWLKEHSMSIVEKRVENEWITRKWRSTSFNILSMWLTTCVVLIWHTQAGASGIKSLSHPDLMRVSVPLLTT